MSLDGWATRSHMGVLSVCVTRGHGSAGHTACSTHKQQNADADISVSQHRDVIARKKNTTKHSNEILDLKSALGD